MLNKSRFLMSRNTQRIKDRQSCLLLRVNEEIGLGIKESRLTTIQGKVQPTFRMNYSLHI